MKSVKNMSLGELAAYVCTHLTTNGVECVLSGGACVSVYTNNKYQSNDLDFIENIQTKRKRLTEILREIEFYPEGRYFINEQTKFFIEFPPGPLSVGDEPIAKSHKIDFNTGQLTLLTSTDCVKDRLAGFYYWDDLQCLEQAVLVAKETKVNKAEIRRWSEKEKQVSKFKIFLRELKK